MPSTPDLNPPSPTVSPLPDVSPAVWDARGTVTSEQSLTDVDPRIGEAMGAGKRMVYSSTSGLSGSATEVSGTAFVPKGQPPEGGWPVVSLAHGLTGLGNQCGPSLTSDLAGFGPAVATFLTAGYAVAFTDYEGLGAPGVHPFLEPRAAAFNVIDAVRALRSVFPDVSPRWVALGNSQGGQAAWAADEFNAFYGDGLDLLGAVSLAPAANFSMLPELAFEGRLTPDQQVLMPLVVAAVERSAPSVPVDHLLHGGTLAARDAIATCGVEAQTASGVISEQDVTPASRADVEAFTTSLRTFALPQESLAAPMLVLAGLQDRLISSTWIRSAVQRSCRMGGRIEYRELPDADHAAVVPDAGVMSWVADRFQGQPAPTNCDSLRGAA